MVPGTALVRHGAILPEDKRLPKGLVGRVWREFARPYRRRLTFLLLAIVGASTLTVLPAWLVGRIVNVLERPDAPGADGALNLLVVALVAVALGAAAFSLLQRYLSASIGEELIYDLRRQVFDHVQRMPISFFTRTQTGALISRLNNDVIGAQRALTGTFGTLTANVVQSAVAVGTMLFISWQLTVLVLGVLPAFVLLAKSVGRRLQELTRQSMSLNADMNTVMTERLNVAGAMLVKLFGNPARETDEFSHSARGVADIGVRSAVVGRIFFALLALVGTLGTALVYWLGGQRVLTGQLPLGDVVTFALLVTQAYSPLAALTNAPIEVLTALVSFDRVFEILDLVPPIRDREGAVELIDPHGEVAFSHVTFAYPSAADSSLASLERGISPALDAAPGALVLRDVSFRARPGETVALVGPSGAGKSTLLNLVPRLYDVTDGVVRLDGHDVRDLTLRSLADAVGVVTQDPHLFHDTVRANLRYARRDATDDEIRAACEAAQIHHVIEALPEGYETMVGERGYRFSGGEKQRLAIARVLLKDPAVVVLDEATAHLDSESEALVQRAFTTALAGRTSLVIAHRLSTIVDADQILVVQAGRIVQRGTHVELVQAGGLYASLYRTQFAQARDASRPGHDGGGEAGIPAPA
ncbi:MAG: ATP-binding cassette domain-containing protein [Nitriliruptorales bacterium]|nr:ATP-binding cassette domain-containing protein [Nitriliruptorales bacterium]